jgi:uncharacterized protein
MKQVFADTGYWIAILNPKDELHGKAMEVSRNLGQVVIVTSEVVLTELANYFADRGASFREKASAAIESIRKNPNARLILQTSLQFQSGAAMYRRYADKEWSLTDCTSIETMQEQGINDVLAYDQHFKQAGLVPLLRD